uniref:Ribonuclease A-domain domain-containing protein n=1 Tax=Panagrolaimus sp. PS1159 TaxID=55785 RepID=A0AC35G1D3_9BILA
MFFLRIFKLFGLLLILAFFTTFVESYTKEQKQRYLDEHGTDIILKVPDVTQCLKRRTYLVNYILYMCFHYGIAGTVKALIPMACATTTDKYHQRINMNKQWKDQSFAYVCVKEGPDVKFKPITCLYQNAEIQINQTIRVNNDELKCVQNVEGDLAIIQKHCKLFFH